MAWIWFAKKVMLLFIQSENYLPYHSHLRCLFFHEPLISDLSLYSSKKSFCGKIHTQKSSFLHKHKQYVLSKDLWKQLFSQNSHWKGFFPSWTVDTWYFIRLKNFTYSKELVFHFTSTKLEAFPFWKNDFISFISYT